jgi:hypothetical protein
MIVQMGEPEPEPESEDEIESPGTIRHRMILAERGLPPPIMDDSDSDSDGEMTEDEFDEEELLE